MLSLQACSPHAAVQVDNPVGMVKEGSWAWAQHLGSSAVNIILCSQLYWVSWPGEPLPVRASCDHLALGEAQLTSELPGMLQHGCCRGLHHVGCPSGLEYSAGWLSNADRLHMHRCPALFHCLLC